MLGGGRTPGPWAASYAMHFLGCAGRGSKCDNELEKEAYDFVVGVTSGTCGTTGTVRGYVDTALLGILPCNCATAPWPVANSGLCWAGRWAPSSVRWWVPSSAAS
jgi:hypothetical protein